MPDMEWVSNKFQCDNHTNLMIMTLKCNLYIHLI